MHTNRRFGKKNQGGFSLLELAVVIAVIAILVIIVVKTSSSVSSTRKASAEVSGLSTLIQNSKQYKTGGSYGVALVLDPILIAANQVPGQVTVSGAALLNQWGGAITITGNAASLSVSDAGVSADACEAVVTGAGSTDPTMVTTVGGTVAVVANGQISAAAAATACGTGTVTIVTTTS